MKWTSLSWNWNCACDGGSFSFPADSPLTMVSSPDTHFGGCSLWLLQLVFPPLCWLLRWWRCPGPPLKVLTCTLLFPLALLSPRALNPSSRTSLLLLSSPSPSILDEPWFFVPLLAPLFSSPLGWHTICSTSSFPPLFSWPNRRLQL